jgi:FkbM family methyltransferase
MLLSLFKKSLRKLQRFLLFPWMFSKLFLQTTRKNSSKYQFSLWDKILYVWERLSPMPRLRTINQNEEFGLFSIKKIQFIYPNCYKSEHLPWLFHEVFDPFSVNPSSYAHPSFEGKKYKWIIDAGACEGFYSIFASLKYSPENIVVIEPDAHTLKGCKETFHQFYNHQKCHFLNVALSDEDCDGYLVKNEKSSDFYICKDPGDVGVTLSLKVQLMTLDTIFTKLKIDGKVLIKMDVEDSEISAVLGATESMRKHDIDWCIAVYHSEENALRCADIIKECKNDMSFEFRGYYGYYTPPRPYLLYASNR